MGLISRSLLTSLSNNDKYHQAYVQTKVLEKMREKNLVGRKSGGGFYKLSKDANGKTTKQEINFDDFSYRTSPAMIEYKGIEDVLNCGDKYSKFMSDILQDFFSYIISLIPAVTNDKNVMAFYKL